MLHFCNSLHFVYNSMGTIDENALQNLSLIINLSNQIQVKANQFYAQNTSVDPDEISEFFPSFLWVIRDFSLRLLDQYGNNINARDYLDQAL